MVQFGAGITASELTFTPDGNDLVISVAGSSGTLTIQDWFLGPSYQVGSFELSNGTAVTPDIQVVGSASHSTLVAGPGEDLLGGSENDVYVFNRGAGSNVIYDNAMGTQTITHTGTTTVEQEVFNSASFAAGYAGNYNPPGFVVEWDYYRFFVPQYGIDESRILSSVGASGNPYIDVIGYAARTVSTTYTTTQPIQVSNGANTLLFGSGISASDLEIQASGNDLIVAVKDPNHPNATFAQLTDKITIQNWVNPLNQVQTFQFADGSTLNASEIIGLVNASGSDTLTSASGINALIGNNSDAILLNGTGSTGTLVSASGGDVLSVTGSGNTLIAGTATDTLTGGSGNDTFVVTSADGAVIRNFQVGSDKIDLTSFANVISLGNLSFGSVTVGGQASVTIDAGSTQLVTLVGVTGAQLSASNFLFAGIPGLSFTVLASASGAAGSAIELPITASLTDGTLEDLSIEITGVPSGTTLSAGTRNADGSWTLTSSQLSGLALTAPAGSFAGTADLTVTASATDVSDGAPVSVSTNLPVTIAGVASAPTLSVENASGNAGTAIALSIASALTATDGTESLAIKITGVPSVATLSAGTKNADGSWSLTATQLSGLTLSVADGAFAGTANLRVTSTATEADGSQATASANPAVAIAGVATAPTLSVQNASGTIGTAIQLSIASALTATDGTESLSINIAGLPSGATLSAGTQNANGSWTLTLAQLSNLSVTVPTGNFSGNLAVTATATETDGSQASTSANLALAASANLTLSTSGANVVLQGGSGNDTLTASGSGDTLIGGSGQETLSASGGTDTLIGGSGTDTLSASGSNDVLIGGSGNDTFVFAGGSNSDIINNLHTNEKTDVVQFGPGITASELTFTPDGNDLVISVAGSSGTLTIQDWFLGPSYQVGSFELSNGTAVTPDIQVVGSASHSTLVAGPGEDLLGGSENDVYVFNRGAGSNVIYDNAMGTQTITHTGTTTVEQEVFNSASFAAGYAGNYNPPGFVVEWDYYRFFVPQYGINESRILSSVGASGNPYIDVIGYAARTVSTTYTTTQPIQVSNGANTLLFGSGISASDLEIQASGNDLIVAVKDPNHPNATFAQLTDKITIQNWVNPLNQVQTFQFADGSTLNASEIIGLVNASGSDTLTSASGINALIGNNSDAILLGASGATGTLVSGSSGDVLSVTGSGNTLIAGTATDTLSASGSGNTLTASTGHATLIDGGTQGVYQYGPGDGQATIVNGSSSNASATNQLNFGSSISDEQLWFLQSGNNLQIDVLGTSSQVTINNWFGSTGNQLQEITAGGLKIDSQVSQLVQAMATYSANNPGFNPEATGQQMSNNSTLQTAIGASWHS